MVHIDDVWRHYLALAIVRRAREEDVPLADTQAALVQSMIPTDLPTWTTRRKSGYDRIYQRVKWRVQNTAQNGLAFSLFENVPTDTPLETDLAMIRGNTAAQGGQLSDEVKERLIAHGILLDRIDHNTRPPEHSKNDYEVSQADAARDCEVSERTIINWEQGRGTPKGYSKEVRLKSLVFHKWKTDYLSSKRRKRAMRKIRQQSHKTNA